MKEDPRITEARRLLMAVDKEVNDKQKEEIACQKCRCGHMRKEHTKSYNINYTDGMCTVKGCDCRHYL